ncbi:ATP-grasp domain-containing protein [Seinonella peptonophila]|uniref:ATP-grasp domain-containing protein n=1 Tax=Seinonella peptonophila TaxID=112248 RepID=A0A1M4WHJ6_9BACL|nr:ATP-grasp domain-containing protein [Seinonella peptonophila]SHE80657.1 ATP-grasp domain-containing protein [Seinonella peptonophila]
MSTKRIMLTGGRAPATLDLARLLATVGHIVMVAESQAPHLCQYSRAVAKSFQLPAPRFATEAYISKLVQILIDEEIDIFIPTCEEIFYIAQFLNQFPTTCKVWCEPISRLQTLHNKHQFFQLVQSLGLKTPYTVQIRSRKELEQTIEHWTHGDQIVLKPTYSRFGTKTYIQSSQTLIDKAIQPSLKNPWLVQQWIDGQQFCTYSVSSNGKILAHADYFTEFTAGAGATIAFTPVMNREIEEQIQYLLSSLKLTGHFGFDWIVSKEGKWYLIECNPRLTSGIHLFTAQERIDRIFCGEQTMQICYPQLSTQRSLKLAMWSYGLAQACRSPKHFQHWLKAMWRSKDTLFRLSDPAPLWGQIRCLFSLYRKSSQQKLPILDTSTYDIEWNGDNR